MPSTRRSVLAACSTAVTGGLAGCSGLGAGVFGSREPPLECGPEHHPWPAYGRDAARTGTAPAREFPPADADVRRLTDTGSSVGAPPVIDGEGVVYAAGGSRIEARDSATGERLWDVDPEDTVDTSPVLGCDTVFVSTLNGTQALDREDGSVRWEADAGSVGRAGSPALVDDTLFLVSGGVTALDAETGEERWSSEAGGRVADGVAVDGRVYVGASNRDRGHVAAVTRDGDVWWRTDVGPVYSAPVVAGGTVYATAKNGRLYALDAEDGSVRWQAGVEQGVFRPPAVTDDLVVVPAGNGRRTMAFDAASGERQWTYETGQSGGSPAVYGDRVLVPGANTGVHALDLATADRVRRWDVPAVGSTPVVAGGRLCFRAWNVSEVFVVG